MDADQAAAEAPPVPSAPATPPRRRGDLRSLVRWTGELLSVAAAVSFLLSVWANQLVFERWGLSFLQVATLADVVTSGLNLLFWGLIPLTLIFLAGYAIGRLRGQARWLGRGLAALATLLFLVGSASMFTLKTGVVFTLIGGVVLTALLLPGAMQARARPSRSGRLRQGAVAVLLCITAAALVQSIVSSYEEAGYGGDRPLHLSSPALPGCVGHVMWSGERALVLGCTEPRDDQAPEQITVVYEAQGWTFRRMPRAEADHQETHARSREASPRPPIR